MPKPRLRATARWMRSFALPTSPSAYAVRSQACGIYAFDTYGMVGKERITVNFEGRKYGGEARAWMRSRRQLTPTSAPLPPPSPLRFQEPAPSEPLRDLAKEYPACSWSNAGRDAKDGRFYECDTNCTPTHPST
jgi:hypothetical protein